MMTVIALGAHLPSLLLLLGLLLCGPARAAAVIRIRQRGLVAQYVIYKL
jgi:hypothetical protein